MARGLKVVALVHENPDEIPPGKSEKAPALREKLQKFTASGMNRFWSLTGAGQRLMVELPAVRTKPTVASPLEK